MMPQKITGSQILAYDDMIMFQMDEIVLKGDAKAAPPPAPKKEEEKAPAKKEEKPEPKKDDKKKDAPAP